VIEVSKRTKLVALVRLGGCSQSVDKTGSSDQMWWLTSLSGQHW